MNLELSLSWYENNAKQTILKVGELNVGGVYAVYHQKTPKWRCFCLLPMNAFIDMRIDFEQFTDHDNQVIAQDYLLSKVKQWFDQFTGAKLI